MNEDKRMLFLLGAFVFFFLMFLFCVNVKLNSVIDNQAVTAKQDAELFAQSINGKIVSCVHTNCILEKEGSLYPLVCPGVKEGGCYLKVSK